MFHHTLQSTLSAVVIGELSWVQLITREYKAEIQTPMAV